MMEWVATLQAEKKLGRIGDPVPSIELRCPDQGNHPEVQGGVVFYENGLHMGWIVNGRRVYCYHPTGQLITPRR